MPKTKSERQSSRDTEIDYGEDDTAYSERLHNLQVELVKLQRDVIENGEKVLLLFEGRDGAGKDGTIKRIVEHLSPRETHVVALGTPSDRDRRAWYFQRYVPFLPVAQEIVCFNRSWYNRAGVEHVMGFCTALEYEQFFAMVPSFEAMLIQSGITLIKYYLDISYREQKARLKARRKDPLTQWKISPIDAVALDHWDDYTKARDDMLKRTHNAIAPWTIVRADNKHRTRLNVIRDVLHRVPYDGRRGKVAPPDPHVVFPYGPEAIEEKRLAR